MNLLEKYVKCMKQIYSFACIFDLNQNNMHVLFDKNGNFADDNVYPINTFSNVYSQVNIDEEYLNLLYKSGIKEKNFTFLNSDENEYKISFYPNENENIIISVLKDTSKNYDESKIIVTRNRKRIEINIKDIIFLDYGNHSVEIYTEDGVVSVYNVPFETISKKVLIYDNFVHGYKNCVVNMDKVVSFENMEFHLNNGEIISVPKRKQNIIFEIYKKYKSGKSLNI